MNLRFFEIDNPYESAPLVAMQCEHLDSMLYEHHDAAMRTTVTLEKDVERMLRDEMHHSRQSFKATLNAALRAGLGGKPLKKKATKFVIKARTLGLRAGIDPASFNKLADDLEVDGFLAKTTGKKKRR